jgi:glutamate/tyrosine decarboxylase-like PLP-dependent enzyme
MKQLLEDVAARAGRYLDGLKTRRVFPDETAVAALDEFETPLPDTPTSPGEVIELLDRVGSPATVASAGGRYFGFVTGAALPATVAANWLAGAWDQSAAFGVGSPVAVRLERIATGWVADLFGLPGSSRGACVTGTTLANVTALAAARNAVLTKAGWDVEGQGLFGAPPVTVVVGAEAHSSLFRALGLLGLGRDRVVTVEVDGQGAMRADAFPDLASPAIVCTQAGNVNTGAFDPVREISTRAHETGSWVHVDGAFGLWAAGAPERAHLVEGVGEADSWATDCHKWLNVPYDSGLVFVRDPEAQKKALMMTAAYLQTGNPDDPLHYTPDASRRARGIEVWAALRSLGRSGLAEMVERNCRLATRFADALSAAGFEILNQVHLNQVLVSFGDDDTTQGVIEAVQKDGTCWAGGTFWGGRAAMRISVSSWATTEEDVEHSLDAIVGLARGIKGTA